MPEPDLLVGSAAIRSFLLELGLPARTDPFYLRRTGRWPIQNIAGKNCLGGGKLVASRRRLREYIDDLTRGPSPRKNRIISKLQLGRRAKKVAANTPKRRRRVGKYRSRQNAAARTDQPELQTG